MHLAREDENLRLMDDSEIKNPLAKRMHEKRDTQDAQRGADLLEKDFIKKGEAKAPEQLKEINSLLAEFVRTYNVERPPRSPELRHFRNRVDTDNFRASFELEESSLKISVGPLFLVDETMLEETPEIRVRVQLFQAYEDDKGFAWRDVMMGQKYSNREVVDLAMVALGEVL
jgi:hypothetical protein